MGYIHHAKGLGDMELNNCTKEPQKQSKWYALDDCLSILITQLLIGSYTFRDLVYIDISSYL